MRLLYENRWQRPSDGAAMRRKVYKMPEGILSRMFLGETLIQESASPRPYQPGQACDGTIDNCVIALFIAWCWAHDLDVQEVYLRAYPDEKRWIRRHQIICWWRASQEGITLPVYWGNVAFFGLCESLSEINLHALRSVVEDIQAELDSQ
jgi:hypothetical protein